MYAIIQTGGKQYWITEGDKLRIEKLEGKEGDAVNFDALWASDGKTNISADKLPGAKVSCSIVKHTRTPKVVVFRKKPKKAYQKTIGHRQNMTEIQVTKINFN